VSQEVARLEELLLRVQRNAAQPRTAPAALAAAPAPPTSAPTAVTQVFSAPEVPFDPEPLQPVFEAPLPYPPVGHHEARQVQSASLDQSVDDMLLADPFPSVAPAPPAAPQSLTDMLDEDPALPVSVSAQQAAPGEDISGVMNRSDLAEEPPEELLEDDIVEMTSGEVEAVVPAGNHLDDLNFDDDELSRDADVSDDEPPASSSRHKVAGTMDEALAHAAEQIEHDEGREVPLKTPPPESGPQAAMALPVGIHAPLAPDIEELLEADILPVGGVNADLPTTEQLGQTIDLEEARGPHLELDSALAASPPVHEERPNEELEVTLPRREFGGGYQADLMPPPEARQELDAHRQRFGEESVPPPPESLAQYPSQQPAPHTDGFAPQLAPTSLSTDSYSENVSTVTVDAPPNTEFAPELLVRPEIAAGPVAKFIRVESPRPSTFLEMLDASLVLGSN
jgi:hypothetical protein